MEVCVSRVCLKRTEDVADTATVSDAIDDQETVKILLLPFLPFGRAGEEGGYL